MSLSDNIENATAVVTNVTSGEVNMTEYDDDYESNMIDTVTEVEEVISILRIFTMNQKLIIPILQMTKTILVQTMMII